MNSTYFFDKLTIVSSIGSVLPALIGLIFIRSIKGYLIPVFVLVLCAVLADWMNSVASDDGVNNLYIFHLFTVLEFTLLSILYFLFYRQNVKTNYIFLIIIPAFYIVAYIEYRMKGLDNMDNLSTSIEALILTVYSLAAFLTMMNKLIFKNLLAAPFFWINSAILLYFLGDLLIFAFCNYNNGSDSVNMEAVWGFHSMFNILFNLLICVAFWKARVK